MEGLRRCWNKCQQDESGRVARGDLARVVRRDLEDETTAAAIEAFARTTMTWSDVLDQYSNSQDEAQGGGGARGGAQSDGSTSDSGASDGSPRAAKGADAAQPPAQQPAADAAPAAEASGGKGGGASPDSAGGGGGGGGGPGSASASGHGGARSGIPPLPPRSRPGSPSSAAASGDASGVATPNEPPVRTMSTLALMLQAGKAAEASGGSGSAAAAAAAAAAAVYTPGDVVDVNWMGGNKRGTVMMRNRDGTYRVELNEGAVIKSLSAAALIMVEPSSPTPMSPAAASSAPSTPQSAGRGGDGGGGGGGGGGLGPRSASASPSKGGRAPLGGMLKTMFKRKDSGEGGGGGDDDDGGGGGGEPPSPRRSTSSRLRALLGSPLRGSRNSGGGGGGGGGGGRGGPATPEQAAWDEDARAATESPSSSPRRWGRQAAFGRRSSRDVPAGAPEPASPASSRSSSGIGRRWFRSGSGSARGGAGELRPEHLQRRRAPGGDGDEEEEYGDQFETTPWSPGGTRRTYGGDDYDAPPSHALPAAVDQYIDVRVDMERRMSAAGPRKLPQPYAFVSTTTDRRGTLSFSKELVSGAQAASEVLPFTEALFKAGVSETPHSTKQGILLEGWLQKYSPDSVAGRRWHARYCVLYAGTCEMRYYKGCYDASWGRIPIGERGSIPLRLLVRIEQPSKAKWKGCRFDLIARHKGVGRYPGVHIRPGTERNVLSTKTFKFNAENPQQRLLWATVIESMMKQYGWGDTYARRASSTQRGGEGGLRALGATAASLNATMTELPPSWGEGGDGDAPHQGTLSFIDDGGVGLGDDASELDDSLLAHMAAAEKEEPPRPLPPAPVHGASPGGGAGAGVRIPFSPGGRRGSLVTQTLTPPAIAERRGSAPAARSRSSSLKRDLL